jgi:pyruvate/2-oxoglutarate dehydrogenase complex dihydrolipoamide dehydrogenase (E3) component/uncharacterized membrane protein YdjX (TVP38/TMEM64 family)
MATPTKKLIGAFVVLSLVVLFFALDLGRYMSFDYLKSQQSVFQGYYSDNPLLTVLGFFFVYVAVTALSLPGAAILTLAGGVFFGTVMGTVVVSIASTVGATLAFFTSRFLLQDTVQLRFQNILKPINEGFKTEGSFYLFSLRLIPIFPFFVVNLVMGLLPIKTLPYFFISMAGMLPGTIAYVNAGTQISQIESPRGILSFEVLVSFALLGLLPFLAKTGLGWWKYNMKMRRFKRPKKFDYNVMVIGAGSAGLVTSYIAATLKGKVALVEKHKMGGDCLNTGCVPSKALIKSAKIAHTVKKARHFGIETSAPKVDFAAVMERIQNVVQKIEPHDSIERYTNLGVECLTGHAHIESPYHVRVNEKTYTTRAIVVATGARPIVPPLPGIEKITPLTSDNIWNLRKAPSKLIVLGGGPIGCELAQSFARLGISVTQVEQGARLMPREDEDVASEITRTLESDGVQVLVQTVAKKIDVLGDGRRHLICESNGQAIYVEFDEILFAVGRKALVTGFGLEELGVTLNTQGTINHDAFMSSTSIPNIYVCGDVAGPYQFTHMAAHQAYYASVNALLHPLNRLIPPPFNKSLKVNYKVVPWATFTDPEIATVGLTETSAKAQNISYDLSTYGIDDLDRAIADGDDHGFVKVLTKPGSDQILGATIVGSRASDMIVEFISAMKQGYGLNSILGTVHIYPTLSEANKFTAGNWKRARKPKAVLKKLETFFNWRRS